MIWLHSLVESLRTCVWFVSLTCLCCYSYFCSYCISVLVVSVNCDVVMLMFRHAAQGLTQQYFLPPSFQLAVFVFSVCGGGRVGVCVPCGLSTVNSLLCVVFTSVYMMSSSTHTHTHTGSRWTCCLCGTVGNTNTLNLKSLYWMLRQSKDVLCVKMTYSVYSSMDIPVILG